MEFRFVYRQQKWKICAIGALITFVPTKQFETLQWHNKVLAIFLLKWFIQRNSQVSLLASTSWVEGTRDSDSEIQVCGLLHDLVTLRWDTKVRVWMNWNILATNLVEANVLGTNVLNANVSDAHVLDKCLGHKCIGLWDANCLGWNVLDANVTDVNGLNTRHIAYCVLLKHCIDSKCVHDIMQCFRRRNVVYLESPLLPKCCIGSHVFSCTIASLGCEIN